MSGPATLCVTYIQYLLVGGDADVSDGMLHTRKVWPPFMGANHSTLGLWRDSLHIGKNVEFVNHNGIDNFTILIDIGITEITLEISILFGWSLEFVPKIVVFDCATSVTVCYGVFDISLKHDQ